MTEISEWEWAIGAGVLMAILILGSLASRLFSESQADEQDDLSPSVEKSELDELREKLKARDCELDELREKLKARDCELDELREKLKARDCELDELREKLKARDCELDELREKLKARDCELDELREKLKACDCELDELREKLKACDCELTEAQEEAELTLLQLHQVQEELEHYFLESRELHQKLDMAPTFKPEQLEQLQRIKDRLVQLYKTMPTNHADSGVSTRYVQLQELVLRQHHALSRFERLHASSSINMKAHQL